ncbi:MAG: hypothetical protein JWP65_506 [Ramlibacter sp.]|uniref:hypothetical protein n=1 Tax=Ramlibacter sp. TaxID=1917967 RepID=UPI002636C1C9|nr:hypothetical protein [Ramlibacter sp.]MDB5750085.1 hypothetical protein [Ramlibacter sp.]
MSPYVVLLAPFLASALLWLAAPGLFARLLDQWLVVVALVALAWLLFTAWRRRQSRRQREQAEGLRDSALW